MSTSDESENSLCSMETGSSTGSGSSNTTTTATTAMKNVVTVNKTAPQIQSENNNNNRGPYKPRDLFGVQLEVCAYTHS